MKRKFRLTRSTDIKRVRRFGKSYAHPLVVLFVFAAQGTGVRVGVVAGRAVGNAVVRNRAKRRLRACVDGLLPRLLPGWDVLLLARKPIATADFQSIQSAVKSVFERADLFVKEGKSNVSA